MYVLTLYLSRHGAIAPCRGSYYRRRSISISLLRSAITALRAATCSRCAAMTLLALLISALRAAICAPWLLISLLSADTCALSRLISTLRAEIMSCRMGHSVHAAPSTSAAAVSSVPAFAPASCALASRSWISSRMDACSASYVPIASGV